MALASSLLSCPTPRTYTTPHAYAASSATPASPTSPPQGRTLGSTRPPSPFRSSNDMPHIFFRGNTSTLPEPCPPSRTEESGSPNTLDTLDTPLPKNFPAPEPFIAVITQRSIEALMGRRPTQQLQTWFTPSLYSRFARQAARCARTPLATCARYPTRVCRVRCTHPRARVAEAAVIAHDGVRIRAVAIRLEAHHGHWMVIALEIG